MPYEETKGIETYYEQRGEGHPIVFVHGLDGNHESWKYYLDELSQEHQVITYDIRGGGYTGGTEDWPYSIEMFADDLYALVTELALGAPTIVGHSMGAKVALTYAAQYPDALSNLVFASTSHPDTTPGLLPTLLFKGVYVPLQTSLIALFGWETRESVDQWVSQRVFGDENTNDDEDHDLVDSYDAPNEMTAREYWKRNMASFAGEPDSLDLSDVTVPTLVLYGEHDAGIIAESAPRVAEDVSGPAKVVEAPDTGHDLPQESPDLFTQSLTTFVNSSSDDLTEIEMPTKG